ncbi:MAG: glycosyltransferase, partial [Spirochaetaceae bacterium]|nr:glycosyltransferase [Spirochaetaceae bacterium]
MNKSITILLSTYNGEKYIEEQLQSIFAQTCWQNCTLVVRDDGSKDGTLAILKKYEQQGKLRLECGENIGFVRSFFWLINNATEADYYSFADQDDVWNVNKVERAVKMLENAASEAPQKPLLY